MRHFLPFTIQTTDWGPIRFARVLPTDSDPWGVVGLLKDTPWGTGISVVPGDLFSHALHGHATPLLRILGSPPETRFRHIPLGQTVCSESQGCPTFQPTICKACPKVPLCYAPPALEGLARELATEVALFWRDGVYVVVVEGNEFVV